MKFSHAVRLASVVATLTSISAFAAESKSSNSVRASSLKGATITYQSGGAAGTVQDIILDPETGCTRFAVIQIEGGKTIAAPFRVLRFSGPSSYTLNIEKERIVNAPTVDINRVDEFSSPEFTERVYGFYNVSPKERIHQSRTDVNVTSEERTRARQDRESIK